jgi:NTE family protein
MDLELFIKEIPLFSSIPDSQIKKLASCFQAQTFQKDDTIFRQGDPSTALYIISSGAVFIYSEHNSTQSVQVELRRGEFFGEMALLSDMPRSATAKVTLDAMVFCLEKDDFYTLLKENRHIGLFLSRLYARRLAVGPSVESAPPQPCFYTVCATDPALGLSHFLYSMSYHISTESAKRVLVVEPHLELESIMKKFGLKSMPCPDDSLYHLLPPHIYHSKDIKWFYHPAGFNVLQVNRGFHRELTPVLPALMDNFKRHYDLVVFSLTHRFKDLEQQAVRLCDKNLLIINNTPAALPDVKRKLQRLEDTAGPGLDRVRVGVSHLCGTIGIPREALKKELGLSETPQVWVEKSNKAINDQIDTEKRFPVKGARAIARELAGVRVGLALGAGAARGWSHVGVLKVLKENNIHIDMIAGTSMGALVGAIFAAKGSISHLMNHTINSFPTRSRARKIIFDYTLPLKGFLKGKKALHLVANAVENADFMDLMIPTYIVGVDVLKGEEVLFETGDVAGAVRASLSLPVVFAPFKHNGRWMVDGGLLNPVPVDILEQKGADKIIAVCVENPYAGAGKITRAPNILQIIFRTISIVHSTATSGFARKSDVVIYPKAQEFAWDDFHNGEVLMRRGEAACRKVLEQIKTMTGQC